MESGVARVFRKTMRTRVVQGEKLDSCLPSIARNYTRGPPPLTFPSSLMNTHACVSPLMGQERGGVLARGSKARGRSGERALRNLIATLVGQLIIYNRAYMLFPHFSASTFSRKFVARNFGILRMENRISLLSIVLERKNERIG